MRLTLLIVLASCCTALGAAEPPAAPPRELPTSPAEVTQLHEQAEAAARRSNELHKRFVAARGRHAEALRLLIEGAFRAAGGLEDPQYRQCVAALAESDAQTQAKQLAIGAAEKARDADERAALDIELTRLGSSRAATQAAIEALVVQRCLAVPQAKADAEHVQRLADEVKQAERDFLDGAAVTDAWAFLAEGYRNRQIPPGFDLKKLQDMTLPPPADAAQRRAEFARRNDAAGIEALAHDLFRALDERMPGMEGPFTAYRQGHYESSLELFRNFFFDKLIDLERHGIPRESILTGPSLGTPVIKPEWVADAMRGIATVPVGDTLYRLHVGEPGALNWAHVPPEPLTPDKTSLWLQIMRRFHSLDSGDAADGLRSWLIDAYQATGDEQYLRRWADYADDWAINMQRDIDALPAEEIEPGTYDVERTRRDPSRPPATWNLRWYMTLSSRQPALFLTRLRSLALTHDRVAREFPPATLARVLLVAQEEYLAPNILVARATRFNWNMMGLADNVRNAALLGEFKAAQWAGREAFRTFQNHAMFSIMPDGGYVEYSDEGHQPTWLERASAAYRIWQHQRPVWFDAISEAEFRESLTRSGEFLLRHLNPNGYRYRDTHLSYLAALFMGQRISPFGRCSLDGMAPWVVEEEEAKRIIGTVFRHGEEGQPTHTSDVLPYLGEFMLRGGWKASDPFFYMHAGRIPNSNADEDSGGFKLFDFGQHLLTAQPVSVDGRTQNMHYRHVDNVGGKSVFLTHSDGQPIEGRWHTSPFFDLAEGIYEGAYEERPGRPYWSTFQTGGFYMRFLRSHGLPAVTDVLRHTRQVFFVREPSAWVVVDRIRCDGRHDYEIPYEVFTPVTKIDWLRRGKIPLPDPDRRVVIDDVAGSIQTHNQGFPGLTLHHFSHSPFRHEFDPASHDLTAQDAGEIGAATREWASHRPDVSDKVAFVRRTLVRWTGEGDQTIVTFITTAPPDAAPGGSWRVTGRGTSFTAVAPDGQTIGFACGGQAGLLEVGDVSADADTLLLVRPKTGEARGIVLGGKSLAHKADRLELGGGSAEFRVGESIALARGIHPPIKPVTFGPDATAFTDTLDVTMSTPTTGVEIRYTLDGSEPTVDSPRYDKPVRITETCQVRAIAIRPGAQELRWPLDPGYATLPTRAVFTKERLSPAATAAALRPGLEWHYASGSAFSLVATSDYLAPQKTGTTPRLFDVSMREGGNAFVVRYDGFLDVPADGVYTFHAPREFVIPDCDPGYDLRVFVDDQEWWPAMRWHALGSWSRPLARGPHAFRVIFVDTRAKPFKHETWMNWPNPAVLWKGTVPTLELSGPNLEKQPIPAAWIKHAVPSAGGP